MELEYWRKLNISKCKKKNRREEKKKKYEHEFSTTTKMMMQNNFPFNSALTQLTPAEKRRWTAVKQGFTDKMAQIETGRAELAIAVTVVRKLTND